MYGRLNSVGVFAQVTATHHCTAVVTLHRQVGTTARTISCLSCWYSNFDDRHTIYIIIIIIIIILYLSAHMQRPKQALGIAPHEALFKKNKHTQKSLLRHYEELLTVTQISSSTSFWSTYIIWSIYTVQNITLQWILLFRPWVHCVCVSVCVLTVWTHVHQLVFVSLFHPKSLICHVMCWPALSPLPV